MRKQIIVLLNLSLILNQASYAAATPQTINLNGRLFNQEGNAPITETVDFVIGVYDPSGQCELYEEIQSGVNLLPTLGNFSLMVGSSIGGTKRTQNDLGVDFSNVFNNQDSTYALNAKNCPQGYIPAAGDTRKIRITVVNRGVSETLSPDEIINSVPFAISASNLQGFTPDQLIQVKDKVTQSNMVALTNGSDASTLHSHDSTYVKLGSQPSFSNVTITGTPSSLNDATNKNYIDQAILTVTAKVNTITASDSALNTKVSNLTSDQVAEGTINLYFTKERSQNSISVDSNSPLNYVNGKLGFSQASTTASGYLSITDFTTFNSKQNALGYTPVNKAGDSINGSLSINSGSLTGTTASIKAMQTQSANLLDFLDSSGAILSHVDALGHVIIPATQSTDISTSAVTKGYVDSKISTIVSGVSSVNGLSGLVTLTSDNVSQGSTNKYYTTSQAQTDAKSAISVSLPLSYSNGQIKLPLAQGAIFVGDSTGNATAVSVSGDGTISSNGVLALKNIGTAGSYSKVATDSQGRVTSGGALTSSDIPNPSGDVQGTFSTTTVKGIQGVPVDSTAAAPTNNSILAYSSTSLKWALNTISGILGYTPVSNSLPQGNILVGSSSGVATSVTITGDVAITAAGSTTVKKIQGTPLTSATPTIGQVLIFDGTNWAPSSLPASPVSSVNTKTGAVVLSSDNISQGLTNKYYTTAQAQADAKSSISASAPLSYSNGVVSLPLSSGNLFVGNSSGVASGTVLSGDASLSNSGAISLKSVGTAGTYSKVTTDAQGRVTTGAALVASDIPAPAGDVSGTYSTTTVKGIQGVPVDATASAPTNNNILAYSSTSLKWALNTVAGLLGYAPVNKAGDTMTGTLIVPAIKITASPAAGSILTADVAGNGTWQVPAVVSSVPTATVITFSGVNCPTGYLKADGTSYSSATYPTLAAAYWDATNNVYAHGGGAINTNFNVPDLRGRFVRGVDEAATNDPDHSSRTAANLGGNSGNNLGSLESDMYSAHSHGVNDPGHKHVTDGAGAFFGGDWGAYGGLGSATGGAYNTSVGSYTSPSVTGIYLSNSGGNETRPKNVYMNYCIKN